MFDCKFCSAVLQDFVRLEILAMQGSERTISQFFFVHDLLFFWIFGLWPFKFLIQNMGVSETTISQLFFIVDDLFIFS